MRRLTAPTVIPMAPTYDELLDEALRLTFPASDPIALHLEEAPLRLILFGSASVLGQHIASAARARGYEVTMAGRVNDAEAVSAKVRGASVVIDALDPNSEAQADSALREATTLSEGLRRAGVQRVVVASETGTLDAKVLEHYRVADLDWTYVSPAALPGADPLPEESVAIAVLDELELPRHSRQRMTVAS